MTDLSRLRLQWSGSPVVGASVSTFYTLGTPAAFMAAAQTWLQALANRMPNSLVWQFEGSGDVIDVASGDIVSAWSATPPTAWAGTDSGVFAQGVGWRAVWSTGAVAHGRRVKGSTYLVPIASSAFEVSGTPGNAALAAANVSTAAFVSAVAGDFCVYSRPTAAHPVGGHATVSAGAIPDKVSWLRSRRT